MQKSLAIALAHAETVEYFVDEAGDGYAGVADTNRGAIEIFVFRVEFVIGAEPYLIALGFLTFVVALCSANLGWTVRKGECWKGW